MTTAVLVDLREQVVKLDIEARTVTVVRPIYTALVVEGPQGVQGPPGDSSTWQPDGPGAIAYEGDVSIGGTLTVMDVRINPWVQLTSAAYAALTPKDPNTLYVVVG